MTTLIDVVELGADPTGVADSAPAVRAAFERAAEAATGVTVRFPPGRYALWPEAAAERELYVSNTVGADERFARKRIALLAEGISGLVVDGVGAELILHGRQTSIAIIDCAGVAVRGLSIDYAVPSVVDVTVAEAGIDDGVAYRVLSVPAENPFRLEGTSVVWSGGVSPTTGEEYWSARDGMQYSQLFDPASARSRRGDCPLFDGVAAAMRLDARRVRLDYAPGTPEPADAGIVYALRETDRIHPGALVADSSDVTFSDVSYQFLAGFGIVAQNSDGLALERLAFRAPEGTGRHTAGFADFVQCSGMRGLIRIEDCVFDGPHDDPINVHGTYLAVTGSAGDDGLQLAYAHPETGGFAQFAPGDEIEIVDRASLLPLARGHRVTAVDGPDGRGRGPLDRMSITVEPPLPVEVLAAAGGGTLAVENVTATPELIVRGCTFRNVPTRGILVTTRRGVEITGNTFDGITMAAVYISGDANEWWESGPVTDVLIAGNRFLRVSAAALLVGPTNTVADPGTPVHGTIVFRDNAVELEEPVVVQARSVERLVVAGNRLSGPAVRAAGIVTEAMAAEALELDGRGITVTRR